MPSSSSDVEMDPEPHNLAYDPDQDPEEKRDVRKKYRAFQKTTEDQRAQPKQYSAEELTIQVHEVDALFHKVKNPQEATLDSHVLLGYTHTTAAKARAMKSGQGAFDIDDFVSKLITFMGGRKPLDDKLPDDSDTEEVDDGDAPLNWDKIGRKALAKSRRVPVMDFMLGPLSIEQKKRAQVKRAKLEKHKEDERKPQEIREEDIARSENETTKNVAKITQLLNREGGPINMFAFIINPNDFGQSVENLFYLSFLIRDGKCAMELAEETLEPMIWLCEAPSEEDYADGTLKKRQLVMELDMATWRRAIEVFDITEPKIPQRPPVKQDQKGGWYG
ncbi:hypothetical protein PILCRDRAFT_810051 [Piloderma croceum F 1598]|uniref:Non-structural maintenance of chromosomes element 4 n=1 Tax=Piloderma croceum (strain F 1598) TaxID=765440 RepID=A0A0C3BZR6_PILCF|nr:hypothetical protein PILCRDRAFT_810051 [Piloderma croceum F 1598]